MKDELRIFLLVVLLVVIVYLFFTKRSVFERFENYEAPTVAIPSQPYNYMPPMPDDEDMPDEYPTQMNRSMPPPTTVAPMEEIGLSYAFIEPYTNADNNYTFSRKSNDPVLISTPHVIATTTPPSMGTKMMSTAQESNDITNNILKAMSSQFAS